jgi:hypothetical protein
MKRIATAIAIAALGVGAAATTASARPEIPPGEDGSVSNAETLAWIQYQHQFVPATKTVKPAKKATHSVWIIYPGHYHH